VQDAIWLDENRLKSTGKNISLTKENNGGDHYAPRVR